MKPITTVWLIPLSLLLMCVEAVEAANRLSERTHRQLSRVHELMQQRRYDEALAGLDRLRPRVQQKPHAHALVLQTYGYLYANTGQYRQAIDVLSEGLALKALPQPATERSLYVLAQLQMATDDYAAALGSLEQWFRLVENPTADAYALAGTAYAQLERYPEAAIRLNKAIALAARPRENWYRQLLAVYYRSSQYRSAATLLEKMIHRFPAEKDYWLQLSGVHRELDNDAQAMAVMELAYFQGLLSEESELLNLARYYLYLGLPQKAARLLDNALGTGRVSSDLANWQLLIDAWLQAREGERALAATERALASQSYADLYLKRARILADRGRWHDVIAAVGQALTGTGLTSPGTAHLLQGIAHYNLDQPAQAASAFDRAAGFADSREQARQWAGHLNTSQASGPDQYSWANSSQ